MNLDLVERQAVASILHPGRRKLSPWRTVALGIPVLFGYDVIHGNRTIFPVPLGETASWDPTIEATTRAADAGVLTVMNSFNEIGNRLASLSNSLEPTTHELCPLELCQTCQTLFRCAFEVGYRDCEKLEQGQRFYRRMAPC